MANSGKTVIVAALDGTFQRKVKCLVQVLGWDRGQRPRQRTEMDSPALPGVPLTPPA